MIDDRTKNRLDELSCCLIIPTYNNETPLAELLNHLQPIAFNTVVVNDGSTDNTKNVLKGFPNYHCIQYTPNQGKGKALKSGFEWAEKNGFRYAISIDSDGQHSPNDIPKFLDLIKNNEDAFIVGSRNIQAENMPEKNTFGNKFSNFWFWIETGLSLPDTQSGFRLYPIKLIKNLHLFSKKYEFELEVLVKSAWKGIKIIPLPISVYYPPEEERISHFRPFQDFFRISVLNAMFTIYGLLIARPILLIKNFSWQRIKAFIKKELVKPDETNVQKAKAIGFGIFMGIVPIWGYQMLAAVILAHKFKLNKGLVLIASNISIGPMIPVMVYLSFQFGRFFVTEPVSLEFELQKIHLDLIWEQVIQYVIGSVSLAIIAGLVVGILSYIFLQVFRRNLNTN